MKDRRLVRNVWVAVVLLVVVAGAMVVSTSRLIGGSDDVQETLERIEALNDLDTQVADLEVAESRFDGANDPRARQDLVAQIDKVEGKLARSAGSVDVQVVVVIAQRIAMAREAAVTRASSFATARAMTILIHEVIDQLDEYTCVRERAALTSQAAMIEHIAQIGGLAISIAIVVFAFVSLRRSGRDLEERVRDRTAELTATNAELKAEIAERHKADANLKTTEALLRQSLKLEGVGQLAGGIAHDFNNLLTVIISYSEALLDELDNPVQRADVAEIHEASLRAADLTRQLLAFSRQQVLAPKIVDLGQVVGRMEKLLQRLIGEHIELRFAAGTIGTVEVDPGQVEQVIMNLVVNARDAMPSGGTVTIETANVVVDADYAADHPGIAPGSYVMLAVSDTGIGMDQATQSRMFEPFFTTKGPGKGTGLGLSTVFGIVKQSRGSCWVDSEPGAGTTFTIYLPICDASELPTVRPTIQDIELRGSETILLVEDEAAVRKLLHNMLARAGYTVIEASNGVEALRVYDALTAPVDLVLSDVVMPRMGGRAFAEQLATRPHPAQVLFMSGYTDDTMLRRDVMTNPMTFLQKPISRAVLLRRVRDVLDTN